MKQLQYLIVITILLCVNVFAQKSINPSKTNTVETLTNGQVIYQNGASGVNAGPYLALEGFEDGFLPPSGWDLFTSDVLNWQQEIGFANSGLNSASVNTKICWSI